MILRPQDTDAIQTFDDVQLSRTHQDPMEREFAKWNLRSRSEALSHYLSLGWSFGAWEHDKLKGYFLGQPLLFTSGLTQSLWIEKVAASESSVARQLIDTAIRLSREKHFQRVLFADAIEYNLILSDFKGRAVSDSLVEVRTSKLV